MTAMSSGVGLIPEQAWELPDLPASPFGTDPTQASIGFVNGKPAGSASALTWSAGHIVRLTPAPSPVRQLGTPAPTTEPYLTPTQGTPPPTVTPPARRSAGGPSGSVQ